MTMWYRISEKDYTWLYHGTNNPEVTLQNLESRDPGYSGSLGEGIYFSEIPDIANFYGEHVVKAPVRMTNPLVIDSMDGDNYRIAPEIQDLFYETGAYDSIIVGERVPPFDVLINGEWVEIRGRYDLESLAYSAKAAGHDAIIARGIRDDSFHNNEVVVLNPDIILRDLSETDDK